MGEAEIFIQVDIDPVPTVYWESQWHQILSRRNRWRQGGGGG